MKSSLSVAHPKIQKTSHVKHKISMPIDSSLLERLKQQCPELLFGKKALGFIRFPAFLVSSNSHCNASFYPKDISASRHLTLISILSRYPIKPSISVGVISPYLILPSSFIPYFFQVFITLFSVIEVCLYQIC